MSRVFKIIDDGGNRKLDKQEFYWGIKDMGVNISKRESEILIDHLDTDQDGQVNYDEFLTGIRGMPNELRMAYIDKAFCKFDSDGNGRITAADLAPVYDTSFHPRVQSGEMTSEEVFVEFLASFGDKNGDGQITKSEWNDYYSSVSASVDNDDHFCNLMTAAWKLN
jgi:calcyphosin